MTMELSTINGSATLSEAAAFRAYIEEKREIIRTHIAPGCPDGELEFFLEQCIRLRLDPIIRQCYFIKRRNKVGDDRYEDKWTFQVGIDGFRSTADRTGLYVGSDDASFEYGKPLGEPPTKATVTVWKFVKGQRCPFTSSARWDEYVPREGQRQMWTKMPHVMLAKVAEAQALRKAFPMQLGGVYIPEEMAQAGQDSLPEPGPPAQIHYGPDEQRPAFPLQVIQAATRVTEARIADGEVIGTREAETEPEDMLGLASKFAALERLQKGQEAELEAQRIALNNLRPHMTGDEKMAVRDALTAAEKLVKGS